MSEKTLKFNNISLNKKEFHKSKKPIDLFSVNLDQIVVSDKFEHNKKVFKHFIGYQKGKIVKPLCIILPQINGYIKYFENGSKNLSFLIKDNEVLEEYDKIWEVIKDKLGIKFYSEPVYKYRYLKTKVRELDGVIKTNFLGNAIPKENMHYTCIACITVDSILRTNKKNYPQVYLEECKYKIKKIQILKFIKTELKSDSELDLDSDLEKMEAKIHKELEASSDNDSVYDIVH